MRSILLRPGESSRSLGTCNILTLIALCREHKIPRLYLGYRIEGLSAMDYKRAFKPHELLIDVLWREGSRKRPAGPAACPQTVLTRP